MHAKENNQDQLLNQFKTEKTDIIVFLVNGFQMKGQIENFDESSVTLFSQNK
ncbi:RNA chaperone Hfq [Staphylococcus arlettae]|nr:RNA chaperone Hfq [Staphylococcus arlettae]MBF0736989.1 RNA chaperone Hfq [Staphylococcus arlettae]TFU48557.1 RNA chaperone Hfq [Staphylococcus arlettae]